MLLLNGSLQSFFQNPVADRHSPLALLPKAAFLFSCASTLVSCLYESMSLLTTMIVVLIWSGQTPRYPGQKFFDIGVQDVRWTPQDVHRESHSILPRIRLGKRDISYWFLSDPCGFATTARIICSVTQPLPRTLSCGCSSDSLFHA